MINYLLLLLAQTLFSSLLPLCPVQYHHLSESPKARGMRNPALRNHGPGQWKTAVLGGIEILMLDFQGA